MVSATPHRHQGAIPSSALIELNLRGGGEESRNERLSKKVVQLPSCFTLLPQAPGKERNCHFEHKWLSNLAGEGEKQNQGWKKASCLNLDLREVEI